MVKTRSRTRAHQTKKTNKSSAVKSSNSKYLRSNAALETASAASILTQKKLKRSKFEKLTYSARFIGSPVPPAEAQKRWPERYQKPIAEESGRSRTKLRMEEPNLLNTYCKYHYSKAKVDGHTYRLNDYVTINSGNGVDYQGRIVEFFETSDSSLWLTIEWLFRADETVIGKEEAKKHDQKRLFRSRENDAIPLECITSRIKVLLLSPLSGGKRMSSLRCDYYYDMEYSYEYSTFRNISESDGTNNTGAGLTSSNSTSSVNNLQCSHTAGSSTDTELSSVKSERGRKSSKTISNSSTELSLLDMYSGCGGMSTGLCMGVALAGTKLITRWAVDMNESACESFKLNHPETEVRFEAAEDFFSLIQAWEKLCHEYTDDDDDVSSADTDESDSDVEDGEFVVKKILGIRWVDPTKHQKSGLEFKVHWKGYGEDEDSWEPLHALKSCDERLREFVIDGKKTKLLPLPGEVDVICGGPPCQGISGLNRFRNLKAPLKDPKNQQIVVFMDVVQFLKPKFVILENVVDILRFCDGFLGRYSVSRLVQMNYQAKVGLMVAGCYGLPQFRMRYFLVGASPSETLPAFPLPTHDVIVRGCKPAAWERNLIAYDENSRPQLNDAVVLKDAISDLPEVKNTEYREEIKIDSPPLTPFQKFIRAPESESNAEQEEWWLIQDHRPLILSPDDVERMKRVPKTKGASIKDLPGIRKREDGTLELDSKKAVRLPSGKELVPKYCLKHPKRLFGRLWWDETVPTVRTRIVPHNQAIMHPTQDRVLTIRECARLQGFPDHYKLSGPVSERYRQLGNAVAMPVAKALGYALGLAIKHPHSVRSEVELPLDFAFWRPGTQCDEDADMLHKP